MKKAKLKYRTVVISDVHMGMNGCRIDEVNDFLKHVRCDKLILNGDIIDTWALKRNGVWTKKHTRFVKLVLSKIVKRNTRVIYLRGNHDDVLERFLPMAFAGIELVENHVHRTADNQQYFVLHGDIFDSVTSKMKWLAKIGDVGYNLLLYINRWYNQYRSWRGMEYYSLSAAIKAKVKGAVNFISSFEDSLVDIAQSKGYRGVICGHIHTAADKDLGGVHYLNSGDWVESLTALVEHRDGRWEVLTYKAFLERREARTTEMLARREAKRLAKEQRAASHPGLVQPPAAHPTDVEDALPTALPTAIDLVFRQPVQHA